MQIMYLNEIILNWTESWSELVLPLAAEGEQKGTSVVCLMLGHVSLCPGEGLSALTTQTNKPSKLLEATWH